MAIEAVKLQEHQAKIERSSSASLVQDLTPRDDLFFDDTLSSLEQRALIYLRAGIPVHLRGPAGTGKSTMGLEICAKLGRPVALLSGDHAVSSRDLVGKQDGVKTRVIVDRFIHNVQKQETETKSGWLDSTLTNAVLNGHTLFYDEFTRSPPEANNALLMALEERRLLVPGRSGDEFIEAHPEFRAVFTSNPDDYAGVQTPQDALIDRMITLEMGEPRRSTEVGIVSVKTGLSEEDAGSIVDVVRSVRSDVKARHASIRAAIMIGTVCASQGIAPVRTDAGFVQLCVDALFSRWSAALEGSTRKAFVTKIVNALDKDE